MESPDRKDYIRKTNADHICKHEWRMENLSSPSEICNAKRTTVMQGYPLIVFFFFLPIHNSEPQHIGEYPPVIYNRPVKLAVNSVNIAMF